MVVDSWYTADIRWICVPSRVVICGQIWWHRWPFGQFQCSSRIISKVWPGCYDNLLSVQSVSNSYSLFHLRSICFLCSTRTVASIWHVANVVDCGHPFECFCAPPMSLIGSRFQFLSYPMLHYLLPISCQLIAHTTSLHLLYHGSRPGCLTSTSC